MSENELVYCDVCVAYLSINYYSRVHDDTHIKFIERNKKYCNCKFPIRYGSCRKCNPYNCPCGKLIANSKHVFKAHLKSEQHSEFMARNPNTVVPLTKDAAYDKMFGYE